MSRGRYPKSYYEAGRRNKALGIRLVNIVKESGDLQLAIAELLKQCNIETTDATVLSIAKTAIEKLTKQGQKHYDETLCMFYTLYYCLVKENNNNVFVVLDTKK
jgi:hypothetical protein